MKRKSCKANSVPSLLGTDIYVIYRAGDPYKSKGTVFSHTDRPRPVNNLFIFSVCLLFFRWDVCKSVSLRLEEESGNKIL